MAQAPSALSRSAVLDRVPLPCLLRCRAASRALRESARPAISAAFAADGARDVLLVAAFGHHAAHNWLVREVAPIRRAAGHRYKWTRALVAVLELDRPDLLAWLLPCLTRRHVLACDGVALRVLHTCGSPEAQRLVYRAVGLTRRDFQTFQSRAPGWGGWADWRPDRRPGVARGLDLRKWYCVDRVVQPLTRAAQRASATAEPFRARAPTTTMTRPSPGRPPTWPDSRHTATRGT